MDHFELYLWLGGQFIILFTGILKLWREVKKTHTLVNSRLDEFKKDTAAVLELSVSNARQEGFKKGQEHERNKDQT